MSVWTTDIVWSRKSDLNSWSASSNTTARIWWQNGVTRFKQTHFATPVCVRTIGAYESPWRGDNKVCILTKSVTLLLSTVSAYKQRGSHPIFTLCELLNHTLYLNSQFLRGNKNKNNKILESMGCCIQKMRKANKHYIVQLQQEQRKQIGNGFPASSGALKNDVSIAQDARNLNINTRVSVYRLHLDRCGRQHAVVCQVVAQTVLQRDVVEGKYCALLSLGNRTRMIELSSDRDV